ncbi:hypothetical protein D6142_07860, partial [Campylobacter jejuni]|nr:hypothetical protein [Campylobacter jejuni]
MDKEKGKIIVEFNKDISELDNDIPIKVIKQSIEDLFEVDNDLLCKIEFEKSDSINKIIFHGNEDKTIIDNIAKYLDFSFNEIIFENIIFKLSEFDCEDLFKLFFKSSELNISFKNCVFNSNNIQRIHDIKFKKLYFSNCEFNDKLYFNNCVFDTQFLISDSRVSDKFKNSQNKEVVAFYDC